MVAETYILIPQGSLRKMLPAPLKKGQRIRVKISDFVSGDGKYLLRTYGRIVTIIDWAEDPVVVDGWHYPTYKGYLCH